MIKKNKGFKFRLKPANDQIEYFEKAFGCVRKMYNLYVNMLCTQLEEQNYETGKINYKSVRFCTPATLKKDYPYMKEIDSLAFANVQLDFQGAVRKYNTHYDGKTYTKKARKQEKTIGKVLTFKDLKGFPTFKSKKKNQNSFTTNNQDGTIAIIDKEFVKIPKLKTLVRFVDHREIPEEYKIKSATISKDCRGHYYIAFTCECFVEETRTPSKKIVGLDYAQKDFFVSSDDKRANYPHYYRKTEQRLKKEQQKLTRKQLKSNHWIKQKLKISRLQQKIACQRKDWLHKTSFRIAEIYDAVIVEDLDLRNLAQCLALAKNVHDNSFGMFRNFMQYKLEDRGKQFIKIDKWFPSSKMCSCCGNIKTDLEISDRIYKCNACGLEIDRDYNASLNIKEAGSALLAW